MAISRRSLDFARDFACGLIRPAQRLNFDVSSVPVPLRKAQGRGPSDLLSMTGLKGDLFAALKGRSFTRRASAQVKRKRTNRKSEPAPDTRRFAGCRLFFVQRRCEREARQGFRAAGLHECGSDVLRG
jgi:hypothetical protein